MTLTQSSGCRPAVGDSFVCGTIANSRWRRGVAARQANAAGSTGPSGPISREVSAFTCLDSTHWWHRAIVASATTKNRPKEREDRKGGPCEQISRVFSRPSAKVSYLLQSSGYVRSTDMDGTTSTPVQGRSGETDRSFRHLYLISEDSSH
ncbi:unnamed protein product [Urochloa humidicola]